MCCPVGSGTKARLALKTRSAAPLLIVIPSVETKPPIFQAGDLAIDHRLVFVQEPQRLKDVAWLRNSGTSASAKGNRRMPNAIPGRKTQCADPRDLSQPSTPGTGSPEAAKDFVLHSLRHTMLTRGEAGAESFTIMQIVGHGSVTIPRRWVHSNPRDWSGPLSVSKS
jgi:hypothetical protein